MEQITQEGVQVARGLGQRHGFSDAAVVQMMQAMLRSRGGMAQFSHPEFGGSGQWMPGGMLMIGDMFNNALKARVDGLCRDVSAAIASQPMAAASAAPLFVPDPRESWWPAELGAPSATGEQNNVRYAVFPSAGRLAVDVNGQVSVYDTGSHQIAGFSQQQGGGGMVFSTPAGSVSLSSFSPAGGFSQQQQSHAGGLQQQSSSGSGEAQHQAAVMAPMQMQPMTPMQPMSPMQPMAMMQQQPSWWPAELGVPASSGAQNELRYAVFPAAGRLAVEHSGHCRVFDVGGQAIRGVSLQSGTADLILSTPEGDRPLSQFPEISLASEQAPEGPAQTTATAATAPNTTAATVPATANATAATATNRGSDDPYAALERLGDLKAKGILTEEEFSSKKAELLARL